MSTKPGMPTTEFLALSRISPPSTIVSPLCTATVLLIFRCWMVGVRLPAEPGARSLTSCSISRTTSPPEFTRGVTVSSTPVSRNSTFCRLLASVSVLCCCCVVTGTSSPTWMLASWLLSTISVGEDTTLTLVSSDKRLRTTRGSAATV